MRAFLQATGLVGLAALTYAAADPYVGKWKLNPAKSDFGQLTATYEQLPGGGYKATMDGLSYTFTMDNNPEIEVNRYLGGGDLRFFSRTHYGGGAACGPLLHAAMAVATGVCDVVVCYRAMNERSQQRFGIGV